MCKSLLFVMLVYGDGCLTKLFQGRLTGFFILVDEDEDEDEDEDYSIEAHLCICESS